MKLRKVKKSKTKVKIKKAAGGNLIIIMKPPPSAFLPQNLQILRY